MIAIVGWLLASALSNVVKGAAAKSSLGNPDLLAKVAATLVWAMAIVVAVNQIGIAATRVNTLFMAMVGAIAPALGLAFVLGGRETAGEIVKNWYQKGQQNQDKIARAADATVQDIESKSVPYNLF